MNANFDGLIGRTIVDGQSQATILGWFYDHDTKEYRVFFKRDRMMFHSCVWEIVLVEEEPVIIRPIDFEDERVTIEKCCRLEMEARTPHSASPTIVIACECGQQWRWTPTPEGGIQLGRWDKEGTK